MSYSSPQFKSPIAMLLAALLLTSPAFAHEGSHHATGLASGFMHALLGVDHVLAVLAMLAVLAIGIWAARCRRPAC